MNHNNRLHFVTFNDKYMFADSSTSDLSYYIAYKSFILSFTSLLQMIIPMAIINSDAIIDQIPITMSIHRERLGR